MGLCLCICETFRQEKVAADSEPLVARNVPKKRPAPTLGYGRQERIEKAHPKKMSALFIERIRSSGHILQCTCSGYNFRNFMMKLREKKIQAIVTLDGRADLGCLRHFVG